MFMKSGLVALALMTVFSGAASATRQATPQEHVQAASPTQPKQPTSPRAFISGFADGIRSWQSDGRNALLIKSRQGKWYRATLMRGCDARFPIAIGFVPGPGGDFDKFSSVLVDGQRCPLRTFERVGPPVHAARAAS